jgi:hypothetical protein
LIPDCPKHFCFFFRPAGTHHHDGLFNSVEEALRAPYTVALCDECGSGVFGPCRRETRNPAHYDWYEPHEPNLDKAGLPHDHFLSVEKRRPKVPPSEDDA